MVTRVIAIATEKGGVGKTTTATCLAAGLAKQGRTVLLIDMDPQGNAGRAFGIIKEEVVGKNISQVLNNQLGLEEVVIEVAENLYLAPSSSELKVVKEKILNERSREVRLDKAIKKAGVEVDYIILDCPPSTGILNDNCFIAANEIIAPVQLETFAAEGFGDLMNTISDFRNDNPVLDITGILVTMVNSQLKQSKEFSKELRDGPLGEFVFKSEIPRTVKVSEAHRKGESLFDYAPNSTACIAYAKLCNEIIAQEVEG